eukprot:m.157825 g.157825  ORF g.157825 m.157825 type:complete len:93 (+) comp52973_c0_seq8:1255-1533(+)
MAAKRGFVFERFKLIPCGSFSRIEVLDERSSRELPLYASGGYKLFGESKFNEGMSAFMDCLAQFQDHVEAEDAHFKLPYVYVFALGVSLVGD